ncbi:MAG: MATE family efflux transporter [Christensenellales bacterium]|jgi:Na+-driven multidrug efflux pump
MIATRDMTKGNIPRLMIRFSIPILLGSTIDILYTMGDSMVLGRIAGLGAFAAVGATGFYLWLIICLSAGFTSGFDGVFGRKFGAGDKDGLNRAIATAIVLSAATGLALTAAGILLAPHALRQMHTPPELIADALLYARIRLFALPVAAVGRTLCAAFYALGNSRLPFVAGLISMAINLVLDITLLLFTPLGVAAVAIGTVAGQVFSCIYVALSMRRLGAVDLSRAHWRADARTIKELIKVGAPLSVRDFPSAIVALLIQSKVNALGMAYVAGVAAAKGLYSVVFALGDAFSGSVAPFISQNHGAQRFDRISRGMRAAHAILLVCVGATIAVVLPLMPQFLSLFIEADDPSAPRAIAAGVRQLRLILYFLPFHYISTLYRCALRGLGDGLMPMLSGFAEAGARVACLAFMPALIGGETAAYLAEVIGWPCMVLLLVFAYRAVYRRARRAA